MTISGHFLCLFLKNLHRYRQDIRAVVSHDIGITHDVDHIFQVSFCDI